MFADIWLNGAADRRGWVDVYCFGANLVSNLNTDYVYKLNTVIKMKKAATASFIQRVSTLVLGSCLAIGFLAQSHRIKT